MFGLFRWKHNRSLKTSYTKNILHLAILQPSIYFSHNRWNIDETIVKMCSSFDPMIIKQFNNGGEVYHFSMHTQSTKELRHENTVFTSPTTTSYILHGPSNQLSLRMHPKVEENVKKP